MVNRFKLETMSKAIIKTSLAIRGGQQVELVNAPEFAGLGAFLVDAQMFGCKRGEVDASEARRALAFGDGFPGFAIVAGLCFKLSGGVIRGCCAFEFDRAYCGRRREINLHPHTRRLLELGVPTRGGVVVDHERQFFGIVAAGKFPGFAFSDGLW